MIKKISDPPGADPESLSAYGAYCLIKDLLKKRVRIRRKMDSLEDEYDEICRTIARLAPPGSKDLSDDIKDFCFYRSVNSESLENPND